MCLLRRAAPEQVVIDLDYNLRATEDYGIYKEYIENIKYHREKRHH